MPRWQEQTIGFRLLALVLLDVFLDVLCARLGTGIQGMPSGPVVLPPDSAELSP
jgi:hypothetical protein